MVKEDLSKETTFLINEVKNNKNTLSTWCSIHNSKTNDTVDCRLYIQRYKPQIKCFNCGDNHLLKGCLKLRKTGRDPCPHSKQSPNVHT